MRAERPSHSYCRFGMLVRAMFQTPRAVLRLMSVATKPIKPELSRVMQMSYLDDLVGHPIDASKLLAEFPVKVIRLEDFIRSRVREWKMAG